jgi:hypothetical protein
MTWTSRIPYPLSFQNGFHRWGVVQTLRAADEKVDAGAAEHVVVGVSAVDHVVAVPRRG